MVYSKNNGVCVNDLAKKDCDFSWDVSKSYCGSESHQQKFVVPFYMEIQLGKSWQEDVYIYIYITSFGFPIKNGDFPYLC